MKKYILSFFLILISLMKLNAQNITSEIYTGKINENMPVTLYLQSEDNGCNAGIMYGGMYKYNGKSIWLQLEITQNEKMQFAMVEYGFTGMMILKKNKNKLEGVWISPDTKKQLKVEFQKSNNISEEKMEHYKREFEDVNYMNYDC